MKKKLLFLFSANLVALSSFCQTYITNVTIVDVEQQKLVPAQTVIIKDDIISDIQSSEKINIPAGATIINGKGKFLMPGMTDGHVHFFQSGGLYTRPDALYLENDKPYNEEIDWVHNNMEDFLRRYVQTGITTVIDVGSTNNFLQQRDTFTNKSYAPYIYMTGPLLTSWEPEVFDSLKNNEPFKLATTIDDAIKMVRQELPFHPDFIKVWYIVNDDNEDSIEASAKRFEPVFKAIVNEAHKNNLKVAVHATQRFTAQLAVEDGCDYLVHGVENEIISDDFIQLLKSKNIIICPTLIVEDGYINTFAQKNNYSFYDLTKSNPEAIGSLTDLKHLPDTAYINKVKNRVNARMFIFNHDDSVRMVNIKKMADAGITLVAGTDAGNIGTQHASSYITELKDMKSAGMSNWQIIQSATINEAKIFNKENSTGSIAVGKKADMILLDANPVDSLDNLTKIALVFHKGAIIDPDTLIKETPLALVERQVNGFNARNMDAFLEPYSNDAQCYAFPDRPFDRPFIKGKENMRKNYAQLFKTAPNLHCEIKQRIIQSNFIIDKEHITGIDGPPVDGIVIYEIEGNKIKKAYFTQ
jgi:imidazolonepropionase-like amidohydrolase